MRCLVLILAGATLGSFFDALHVASGTTAYTHPTYFGLPWWVPLMYAIAVLGIGLSHPHIDRRFSRPARTIPISKLLLGLLALGAIWSASGLLPLPHWQTGLILGPAAVFVWWAFDRTRVGVLLAVLTAIAGCTLEILLSRLGLFKYTHPDVAGVASWLPWIYVAASVAVGNLGRALTRRA